MTVDNKGYGLEIVTCQSIWTKLTISTEPWT